MDPSRSKNNQTNGSVHQQSASKQPQQHQPTILVPNGSTGAAAPPAMRSRALPQIRQPSAGAKRRDAATSTAAATAASVPAGDGSWRRLPRFSPLADLLSKQIPSPNWHSQSGILRRTVSMGTHHHNQQQQQLRTTRSTAAAAAAAAATADEPATEASSEIDETNSQRPMPLPPVSARVRSPSQRLTEMARMFSSGVVYSAHRGGSAGSASSSFDGLSLAATSAKKRL